MAEINITKSTVLLIIATIILYTSTIFGFILYSGNEVFYLTLVGPLLATLATYSAATDRDMSVYTQPLSRFGKTQYLGESSAAFTFGYLSTAMDLFFILLFALILSDGFDTNLFFITMILLIGTILTAIGAIIAKLEWEGDI